MEAFRLYSYGYIDPESQFEYKNIENFRATLPLLHNHDYYEIFLIAEGAVIHVINDTKILLKKGNLVFVRPNDAHTYEKHKNSDCQIINLAILENTVHELFNFLGKGFDSAQLLKPDLPPTLLLSNNELTSLLFKFELLHTLPVHDKLFQNTQLRIILVHIFSEYFIRRSISNLEIPEWLWNLVLELQKPENYGRGMQIIKEMAFKSEEHVSRSFRKYFGKTPTQYINELRLNYTANQIRFSNRKIPDIAFDSGFENLSHFYRQFKKMFNYTPVEFRRVYQK